MWDAVKDLAEHIKNNAVSKHIILFGADVSLFEGAAFPDDYRRIQVDILNMLSLVGLNAGTGMEPHYGDFGRFRGKLDRNWHIQGVYREEACAFIGAVLAATSSLMVVDTGPSEPEPSSSSMALEASSSSPLIGIGSLDGGGHVNRARQTFSFDALQESPEKESSCVSDSRSNDPELQAEWLESCCHGSHVMWKQLPGAIFFFRTADTVMIDRLSEFHKELEHTSTRRGDTHRQNTCSTDGTFLRMVDEVAHILHIQSAPRLYNRAFMKNYRLLFHDEDRRYRIDVLERDANVLWGLCETFHHTSKSCHHPIASVVLAQKNKP